MMTICLAANTLYYPNGGGHLWVYLNWALGFQSIGCKVIWLEGVNPNTETSDLVYLVTTLKGKLRWFGLPECVALWPHDGNENKFKELSGCMDVFTAAALSDILINQWYGMPQEVLNKFKKTVLLDIDPGLTQVWLSKGYFQFSPHDVYFTIGETVGQPGAKFPDVGVKWLYTAPCVSLDNWPTVHSPETFPFTTVTHWSMDLWENDNGEWYCNDKKSGFFLFLELPKNVSNPLELALCLGKGEHQEKKVLEGYGWSIQDSQTVTATPDKYQSYIQSSRGEFSYVKPSCVRLQNAWISDRTICYLASGKPAVIQHTGPSRFLPDGAGLFRFHDMAGAIRCLEQVTRDYEKQSFLARTLAEEYFDARKITANLLEKAL